MNRGWGWMGLGVFATVVACTQAVSTDPTESDLDEVPTDTDIIEATDTEDTQETDGATGDTEVDHSESEDTEPIDTGDVFEGWPSTEFIPTHCGSCHPNEDGGGWDFGVYEQLVQQYDHIYCGISPEWVTECGDVHEPGHLPRSEDQPSETDRLRMTAWLAAWMPREDGTTMCDHGYEPHHDNDCGDTGSSPWD